MLLVAVAALVLLVCWSGVPLSYLVLLVAALVLLILSLPLLVPALVPSGAEQETLGAE